MKRGMGNFVHFSGTCLITFFHDCVKNERKRMNREGTSYSGQKFEILMFMMHTMIHLIASKSNEAYPNS